MILNKLEGQAVTPPVIGILHEKIEISNDEGFIKTFIPPSDLVPHMANYSQKHYYKRSGDSFYQCEHFDIKEMFFRINKPILSLSFKDPEIINRGKYKVIEWTMSLQNTGKVIAKYPLLQIHVKPPYSISEFGLDGNGHVGLIHHLSASRNQRTYMGGNDFVIYPQLSQPIDKISIELPIEKENIPDLNLDYKIAAEHMESISNTITIKYK